MSRTVYCHNEFHLGDCLISLHLIRALAKSHVATPFVFFCHAHYHNQLKEVVEDLPNILLDSFDSMHWTIKSPESCNLWKNFAGHWEKSKVRWNWSEHTLQHHRWTARRMGFESPFKRREHLLFDYPALNQGFIGATGYDFFVCNSEPSSGQFGPMRKHGSGYLDGLIIELLKSGKSVVSSAPLKQSSVDAVVDEDISGEYHILSGPEHFTVSQIGNMSLRCKNIIGIATGPLWPCVNTTNHHTHEGRTFIAMLDNQELLNLPYWEQCSRVEDVLEIARKEGWVK